MKKAEIFNLDNSLNQLGDYKGVKFNYGIAKNRALLKPEIDSINKAMEPSKDYQEYDKLRVALAEKHSKKDKEGKPMIQSGRFMLEDQVAFEKDFEKLKKEHKKVLDDREKQEKQWNELLEEETPVKLFKIKLEYVPEEILGSQLNAIYSLIEE